MAKQLGTRTVGRTKGLVVLALSIALFAIVFAMTGVEASKRLAEDTSSPVRSEQFQVGDRAFPEEQQASDYRSAMAVGNVRSVTVIEAALHQAESQSPRNEIVVQHLASELERRRATLTMLGASNE